jgi:hypothetical protein
MHQCVLPRHHRDPSSDVRGCEAGRAPLERLGGNGVSRERPAASLRGRAAHHGRPRRPHGRSRKPKEHHNVAPDGSCFYRSGIPLRDTVARTAESPVSAHAIDAAAALSVRLWAPGCSAARSVPWQTDPGRGWLGGSRCHGEARSRAGQINLTIPLRLATTKALGSSKQLFFSFCLELADRKVRHLEDLEGRPLPPAHRPWVPARAGSALQCAAHAPVLGRRRGRPLRTPGQSSPPL